MIGPNAAMKIRREHAGDETAIFKLTTEAFEPMEYSDGSEPHIVNKLRADGDLALSLVAVNGKEIVGHVAFSSVTINGEDDRWFGLGPISVAVEHQRLGIGKKLIDEGLGLLKSNGANGCVLIGDPAYYSRMGFLSDGKITYRDVPNEFVQWLSLGEAVPRGEIEYRPAFNGD